MTERKSLQAFGFTWPVVRRGYRVVEGRTGSAKEAQQFLVCPDAIQLAPTVPAEPRLEATLRPPQVGSQLKVEYTEPLEKRGLYRAFALTDPSPEGILRFAQEHGHLGIDVEFRRHVRGKRQHMDRGEPVASWTAQIGKLREAYTTWRDVQEGDKKALKARIEWDLEQVEFADGRVGTYGVTWYHAEHGNERIEPQSEIAEGDPIQAGRLYVRQVVDEQLRLHTSSSLQWQPETDKLPIQVVPRNLLGTIWLQFAMALQKNMQFDTCDHCGNWFERAPQATRPSDENYKTYCSSSCRYKAYRARSKAKEANRTTKKKPRKGGSIRRGAPGKKRK